MPSFGLFHKQKNQEENIAGTTVEQIVVENVQESKIEQVIEKGALLNQEKSVSNEKENMSMPESVVDGAVAAVEGLGQPAGVVSKTYLKAMPLRDTLDLEGIKAEVEDGNILILRITPLASKSIEAVKGAVNELYMFVEAIGGDIARLGEERVVVCPKNVRIWREKTHVVKDSETPAS